MGFVITIEHLEQFCPHCQAGMQALHRGNQHTNGHWNERIVYCCGTEMVFTPNFYPGDAVSTWQSCKIKRVPCENKCGALVSKGATFCSDQCGRSWAEAQIKERKA